MEDFATAIAKLRSLLEQRVAANGGSNGTDGSVKSSGDVFSPNETRLQISFKMYNRLRQKLISYL